MIEYKELDLNFSLNGKVSVITGGSTGIGLAIATVFAKKGANIVLFDIDKEKGLNVAKSIAHEYKISTHFVQVDVTSKSEIVEAVKEVIDKFSRIDILVNNAGVVYLDDAENISEEMWDKTMAVNLKAVFLMSQEVGKYMIKQGRGKIINMASQAGVIALDNHIAYCASKAAVISITKVLAIEWAQFGININSISPTVVLTELGKKAWAGEIGENMKKLIPNGRFAYPDEIASVALFLASDNSNMINGENIVIDGGYTVK